MQKVIGGLVAGVMLAFSAMTVHAQDVVKVGVAAEPYPPFAEKGADGQWRGFEVDLYQAVCAAAELKCELVELGYDGMIPALQEKKIDVIWASMAITEERKKVIDFTRMYYDAANYMIGAKTDEAKIEISHPESLKGKIVGAQSGTIHARYIEKHFGGMAEVKLYDTLDNALADLKAGRVDYVSESMSLEPFLQANSDFKVVAMWASDPIFGEGVGGGVRKEDAALKDKLNAGIAAVVKSRTYDEIVKKYPGLAAQIVKPQV